MNRNRRRMAEFNARKSAEAMQLKPVVRVEQALKAPNWRNRPEQELFPAYVQKAKYQKVCNDFGRQIHAVQKSRGRSIPLV